MPRTRTPYGTVHRDPYGGIRITSTAFQRWEWAHRPGSAWPGSTLAALPGRLTLHLDARGDLVDVTCRHSTESLDGHETRAYTDDLLALATPRTVEPKPRAHSHASGSPIDPRD